MSIQDEIEKVVLAEIPADLGRKTLEPGEDLLAQGLIDSLGLMKIVGSLESHFNVHVSDEDLVPENFHTLEALVKLVERKRSG